MKKLENKIISYIQGNGPITFDKFMEFALYDKEDGYYCKSGKRFGKSGDFYTSPTVHRAFGNVISKFIVRVFEAIDEQFVSVIEPGCGNGYLAVDILDCLKEFYPTVYENIHYYCIDKSISNLDNAYELLADHRAIVNFAADISDLKDKHSGVVISNELFDALPFHRIKFKDNKPYEIYIENEGESFTEHLGKLSSNDLQKFIDNLNIHFEQDQQIEINLNYKKVIEQISNSLNKGVVVTFDYGWLSGELYSPERLDGTYRCFHNHQISADPYINIGEQDITSSVNFSDLIKLGEQNELKLIKYSTQGQFMVDWGVLDIIEKLDEKGRSTAKNLFMPGTMGDMFKVLIQQKNMNDSFTEHYPESILKISYQSTKDTIR